MSRSIVEYINCDICTAIIDPDDIPTQERLYEVDLCDENIRARMRLLINGISDSLEFKEVCNGCLACIVDQIAGQMKLTLNP